LLRRKLLAHDSLTTRTTSSTARVTLKIHVMIYLFLTPPRCLYSSRVLPSSFRERLVSPTLSAPLCPKRLVSPTLSAPLCPSLSLSWSRCVGFSVVACFCVSRLYFYSYISACVEVRRVRSMDHDVYRFSLSFETTRSFHKCECLSIRLCVCTRTHTQTHRLAYTHAYTHTYPQKYTRTHTHTCTHTYTHTHTHTHTRTQTHTYKHTHTQTYTRAHIHTHTHI